MNVFRVFCLLAFALSTQASTADDGGITVVGVGEAHGKPNKLEFRARVAGSGELAGDALTKYQEFKRRALAVVGQLQLGRVKVSVGAMSLLQAGDQNQIYMMMQQGLVQAGEAAPKLEVALSSLLRVTLEGVDELTEEKAFELATQLVDKLKDAGVRLHPTQRGVNYYDPEADESYALPLLATFVLDDAGALREQARERAFRAARANAEKLAELADLRLGPVEAIEETTLENPAVGNAWQALDADTDGVAIDADVDPLPADGARQPAKLRLTSRSFSEISVRVSLQVRFRARPKDDAEKSIDGRNSAEE